MVWKTAHSAPLSMLVCYARHVNINNSVLELLNLQCLQQYLSYSINNGNVLKITCPDPLCPKTGQLSKNEVSAIMFQLAFN